MSDISYIPKPGYKYWLYDREGDGMLFFKTEADRDAYAARVIPDYKDFGLWDEHVEEICAGVVTHAAQQVDVERPAGKVDWEGFDEAGTYWPNKVKYRCNYALVQIKEKEK